MYAVVRAGGRQYRVQEGRSVKVHRIAGEPGDTVELGEVLLMADGDDVKVGAPLVEGARVLGTIAEQGRDKKIVVFRYKNKTRSRKKTGHRQHFTRVLVDDILRAGQEPKPKKKAAPSIEEATPEAGGRRLRRKAAEAAQDAEPEASPSAEAPAVAATDAADAPAKPKRSRKKAE